MFPNIDTHTSIRIHGADEVKQVARGAEVTRVVHGVEKKGETQQVRGALCKILHLSCRRSVAASANKIAKFIFEMER